MGDRKLHLLNWDKICQPREGEGLGIKKFKFLNQAMVAKQFWRIQHSPNSLLAKTYKAKYFPRTSLQEYRPKSHHFCLGRTLLSLNPHFCIKVDGWLVGVSKFP